MCGTHPRRSAPIASSSSLSSSFPQLGGMATTAHPSHGSREPGREPACGVQEARPATVAHRRRDEQDSRFATQLPGTTTMREQRVAGLKVSRIGPYGSAMTEQVLHKGWTDSLLRE